MVKRVTQEDFALYEQYVSQHPKGHFLQSLPWARFKHALPSVALLAQDEAGAPCGAMLLFIHKEPAFGVSLLYSPRGPVCDADRKDVMEALLAEACRVASEHRAYMLTIDPDVTEDSDFCKNLLSCGFRPGGLRDDHGILQPLAVFRIDIAGKSDDELLAMFHSKARYSVRAALKGGATCRLGTRADIPGFQRLLAETAQRDGFTARSVSYFNEMYDALGDELCKLFIVEYEGEMIAGSVLIRYGEKTWHLYGGSGEAHKDKLPNFLMQWEMMRWSIAHGCTMYDMRGIAGEQDKTKPLEGLLRFKKRFGGELVRFAGRLDLVYHPATRLLVNTSRGAKHKLSKLLGKGR